MLTIWTKNRIRKQAIESDSRMKPRVAAELAAEEGRYWKWFAQAFIAALILLPLLYLLFPASAGNTPNEGNTMGEREQPTSGVVKHDAPKAAPTHNASASVKEVYIIPPACPCIIQFKDSNGDHTYRYTTPNMQFQLPLGARIKLSNLVGDTTGYYIVSTDASKQGYLRPVN